MPFQALPDEPLVSILMPAYNAELYIKTAIESIISQTYPNWQLLICDDGSVDGTYSVICDFSDSRIKLFKNSNNIGNVKTVNFLIKQCEGELFTLLDADDWCLEHRILHQVEAFLADNELGLCGTQSVKVKSNGNVIKKSNFPLTYEHIKSALPNDYLFTSASVMVRSEIIDKSSDAFPEFFDRLGGSDWYFFGALILKFKMINLPLYCYFYRYHDASITNSRPASEDKYIIGEVVAFLVNQRIQFGTDGLSNDAMLKHALNDKILELRAPYLEDEALLDRKYAIRLLFNKKIEGLYLLINDFISGPMKASVFYYQVLSKMVRRKVFK